MPVFLLRRIAIGVVVFLGATLIVYLIMNWALDPLERLRLSTASNKEFLIKDRVRALDLDTPAVIRYFKWLGGMAAYLWGQGTLGMSVTSGQSVSSMLGYAVPTTVKLVSASLILAVLVGVAVGIVTALRQYSAFDYTTTFFTFLFYSLPIFWVAILLKEFGAIRFNDFLGEAKIGPVGIGVGAAVAAVVVFLVAGGRLTTRLIAALIAAGAVGGTMWLISATGWLLDPGLGIAGVAVTAIGIAVLLTFLSTGLENRRALGAALTTAGIGVALYYPLYLFAFPSASGLVIAGLAVVAVGCGIVVGLLWGGPDKWVSARTAAITALGVGLFIFIDRLMRAWKPYMASPKVKGRPMATLGAVTPNLGGNFWFQTMDTLTHLLLPTLALVLITLASYTRYTRASMLEVMNADYIRTARAKGLSERTVVMRHAFRNALLPLATVIPIDIAAVFSGAIITERIFGWRGMGTMFLNSILEPDPNVTMGYLAPVAAMAIGASILADMLYASLDPRIRVDA